MPDSDTPQRWQIIQELAERLGRPMPCSSAEDIFAEMAALTPYYQGMSHSRLEGDGICWPCPSPDHPGTRYLHKDRFVHGKGRFHGVKFSGAAEVPDADYPFWLVTGTMFNHFLTGTMTRRCSRLNNEGQETTVEIHAEDAAKIGIAEGDMLRATTRSGSITAKALISDKPKKGTVFIPMHFLEEPANRLTNPALDPVSKTPEYKACAVKLETV